MRFALLAPLLAGLLLALACAPVGGWLAADPRFHPAQLLLAGAVLLWVAGFDLLYACQDVAFDREQPVWLREGYEERFGLPKTAQGTGMTPEEAYAFRFPEPEALAGYIDAVKAGVQPRLEAATQEYLDTVSPIRPWGERSRAEHLWQVLVAHGNGHLGSVTMARAILGHRDVIGL